MATVKKSKKKVIVPICIVLVIAIVAGTIFGVVKANSGEEVSLCTIATDDIHEKVSLTGDVTAGSTKEYKVSAVATVKEVFVNVGDSVKKGDVLATFDTTSLDSQISSLQVTYNDAVKNYNNSVSVQKNASEKAASLLEEIEELEDEISELETMPSTTKTTTKKPTTAAPAPTEPSKKPTKPSQNPSKPSDDESSSNEDDSSKSTTQQSTIESLAEIAQSLKELNETLSRLTDDMDTLAAMTEIIADSISGAIESGQLNNEVIAELVAKDISKAIQDGIIDSTRLIVESGVAVEMIEAAVAAIDFEAIASGIASTPNVALTSAQVRLTALYAQYAIYNAQADDTIVDAQKTAVNTSKKALDILKNERQTISEGWIAAFDGTITAVDVTAGSPITALTTGITLENLDSMTATVSLSEYDVHKVRVGMAAKVTTAYGTYDGEVTSIAPTATGGSSTSILDSVGSMAGISGLSSLTQAGAGVECKVTIKDTDENIIVGFDADVEIETGSHLGVVVVPIESIKLDKEGSYVYLYNEEENTVTKTKIETGAVSDSAYEVTSGLKAGDRIVSAPASTYEEDTFKVKIKK